MYDIVPSRLLGTHMRASYFRQEKYQKNGLSGKWGIRVQKCLTIIMQNGFQKMLQ